MNRLQLWKSYMNLNLQLPEVIWEKSHYCIQTMTLELLVSAAVLLIVSQYVLLCVFFLFRNNYFGCSILVSCCHLDQDCITEEHRIEFQLGVDCSVIDSHWLQSKRVTYFQYHRCFHSCSALTFPSYQHFCLL